MRSTWDFRTTPHLRFGPGAVREIGPLVATRGYSRVLLVTDGRLAEAGLVERVRGPLTDAGIRVDLFDEGEPEPTLATAARAVEFARRCDPLAVVALGGGSNIDLAKMTALVTKHGGRPQDYFGFDRVPGPVLPLICLPTTAGTGSEVSHAAVLTDPENQMKVSTLSHWLRPELAVVDPELTYGCPPQVTAESGIDALTHAIEAYTATDFRMLGSDGEANAYEGSHPLGDLLAERAIRLIGLHLDQAVHQSHDAAARAGMALAATLAGMAFSNCGVALVHALEYPLGGALHCSHGAGNGLLLPYVMRFNLPERAQVLARVATLLGEDVTGLDERGAAERAISAVERLRERIGIPQNIRELGGRREQLPLFAEKAFAVKRLLAVNPRKATRDDLLAILEAAF